MVAGTPLIAAIIAAAFAATLTRLLILTARRRSLLVLPNERSSHTTPTPTLGGIAIALPVFLWAIYRFGDDPLYTVVLGSGGLLAVLGCIDDLQNLSARLRLAVQCVAVSFAVWMLPVSGLLVIPPLSIDSTWLIVGFQFFLLLWLVNLYNFMDGIDGIAASQCMCYCAGVLLLGQARGTNELSNGISNAFSNELLWILCGSALGFLCFNWAPARIFMGDVASGLLGLLLGVLALTLDSNQQMPLVASLILLTGFWFDATYTLCVRIITGQKFVSAHRSHLYQKCARRVGHGRTTTMLIAFVVAWLMPLAWGCIHAPRWTALWLALAMAPLFVACVRMRAGLPDSIGVAP